MKLEIKAVDWNGYPLVVWNSNIHISLDRVYEVIQIMDKGFLVCHNNRFVIVPFEYAEKTTPLERVL